MAKHSDSKKRIAFPIHLSEGEAGVAVPDVIQILPSGEWDHPSFGKFSIGTREIQLFVSNFSAGVRNRIPITQGHDNGMSGGELPAVGWFTDLEDRGVNGLWGGVEWTDAGKALLTSGEFKYFSAEIYMQYQDPETGEEKECVLVGGALTNKPYFKEMQPVMFSEDGNIKQFNEIESMDLNTILAKSSADRTTEEKAFLKEHKSELTTEQVEANKADLEDEVTETDEDKAKREGDENEAKGLNRDGSAKSTEEIAASEKKGVKTMSFAEHAALEAKANAGAKALEKLEASERAATVEKMIFSKGNSVGRFLPKSKDKLDSFIKSLSETQRATFSEIVGQLPQAGEIEKLFTETGDGGQDFSDDLAGIAKEVDLEVKKFTEGGKMTYSAALAKVFTEKPELKKRYDAALEQGN